MKHSIISFHSNQLHTTMLCCAYERSVRPAISIRLESKLNTSKSRKDKREGKKWSETTTKPSSVYSIS